jgi:hypothetical protein
MSQQNNAPTYMFVFRNTEDQPDPTPEQMQQTMQKWMDWIVSLKANGHFLAGEPLEEHGKVLRGPGGKNVTDGPFAEAKEVVGGFMLIAARDFAHAVELAKACPGYANGGTVEVRQVRPMSASAGAPRT